MQVKFVTERNSKSDLIIVIITIIIITVLLHVLYGRD